MIKTFLYRTVHGSNLINPIDWDVLGVLGWELVLYIEENNHYIFKKETLWKQ